MSENNGVQIWIRGGGGYSWEFVARVCLTVLQILTLFQIKKFSFSTLVFRPGNKAYPSSDLAQAEIMLSLLRFERQLKDFVKLCGIRILLFLFCSFFFNWIYKYVHAFAYSLENHTRIQTKLEAYIRFRPNLRKNHTLWGGGHIPIRQT